MSDFTLWLIGMGTSTAVVIAATVAFVWYSHLRRKLPLAVRCDGLEKKVFELEMKRDELAGQLKDLEQQKVERDHLLAEMQYAKDHLLAMQEKIAKAEPMKREADEVEEKLSVLKDELLRTQAERLQEEERLLKARREEEQKVDALRREYEKLHWENSERRQAQQALDQKIEALKSEERLLNTTLTKLRAEQAEASARLQTTQAAMAQCENQLKNLRNELNSIQKDKRQAEVAMEEAKSRKETVELEIDNKKKALESTQRELETLAARARLLEQVVEQPPVGKKLEDFVRPKLSLASVGGGPSADAQEAAAFASFRRHVERSGFVFHERVLKAFHTSLKIGDISPLVVLAGISGTGKSQLPRLYAEAMGMHFLNVAVQPRWDAPQDLFGFYNYMENRYKATELARALRQMDCRSKWWKAPDDDREARGVQDGILLVLLDEMNLARVEYYFSELLSKLEMRNAALAGNQDALAHALIYLELGSLKPGEESRHMFVGENVLFVGTVNEDETTQSLSDKVIDRANVLRLGRPDTTVRPEPHGGIFHPSGYLPYRRWHDQWRTPVAWENERRQLNDTCKKLNEALEPVARPFGYRVHRAIERYVESYPRWGDNAWFSHALADQLEQKIIPKLRGLSKDDEEVEKAYEKLRPIVEGTRDEQLVQAFRAATERPVFQWIGVSRLT